MLITQVGWGFFSKLRDFPVEQPMFVGQSV